MSADDLDLLLHVVRVVWPASVVEIGSDDRAMDVAHALRTPWSLPCELFVYENDAARCTWSEHGYTADGAARMISVTVETAAICFVVNSDSSPSAVLVENIKRALRHHRGVPKVSSIRKAA